MKVLLVKVPPDPRSLSTSKYFGGLEPLALEYLAAGIQQDHEVKLIDLRVETGVSIKDALESFQPDIIGSGGCILEVFPIKKAFAEVKKILPNVLTVVGGHHATLLPHDFFDPNIDVIVVGEGVFPFQKICDFHQKQKSFKDIKNIYYRENGEMVFTGKTPHPPLDTLPFPARELTSHIRNKYSAVFSSGDPLITVIRGSMGCIYRCKFCSITTVLNHQLYTRDIDCILEELAPLKESYICWLDDEHFVNPQRAIQLARAIDKAGIKKTHRIRARTDHIYKHPECVEEWAKIGLDVVMIGFDSYKDEELKELRKGADTTINEEVVRICHANNVKIKGNFIVHPGYEREDFDRLAQYVRKLGITFPGFTILTPHPGTPLYEELKDKVTSTNYNLFDGFHALLPTRLPLKEFYREVSRIIPLATSPETKVEIMKKVSPQIKEQFALIARESIKRIENAYLDH